MTTRIDISIGPVQGFVVQSRRIRDLWGSSYLLAFLSAHAMLGAQQASGEITQPLVDNDRLFRWVSGIRAGRPPRIGSVPNHLVVETCGDARTVANAAAESLKKAWLRVCGAVWKECVEDAASVGNGTEEIWNRQINAFWEVTWTAEPKAERGAPLARRKHWRSHRPSDEPGDKCTVMHDLQELSGFVRARDREQQDRFWRHIGDGVSDLDLRDNERLCAVALVKRLFPRVAEKALTWEVDASNWPSTVYIGAVPWIRRVVKTAPDLAKAYAQAVAHVAQDNIFPMQRPPFEGLNVADAGDFPKLDANYIHQNFVLDERLCPLKEGVDRQQLADMLQSIHDTKDDEGQQGAPPTFYALLLADGDRLGKLVSEVGGDNVSEALARFTDKVPEISHDHDGVTIYAGGDDVLAMLPVNHALECAEAVSKAYRAAFAGTAASGEATLSAAVVFAHVRLPLSYVVREAHSLLDDIAKDGNGRSSLAVGVYKPSGCYCQWVSSWDRSHAGTGGSAVNLLVELREALKPRDGEPGLSSSLIYRIRKSLALLCGWNWWEPGHYGKVPDGIDVDAFLRAEVLHSLTARMDDGARQRAETLTGSVVNLLAPARNPQPTDSGTNSSHRDTPTVREVGVDALLLARFLNDPEDQGADR